MNCLEFKRLALSDPSSNEVSFIAHSEHCAECLKYVGEVRKMDNALAASLQVEVPRDLSARLQLHSEMQQHDKRQNRTAHYAIAASIAVALFVGGFMLNAPEPAEVAKDYEKLVAAVVEHIEEQPLTPVWDSAQASQTVNTLLASYDSSLQMRDLAGLQFARICPMGEYRGLHATLESENGSTTIAYIKGEPVGELLDASFQGHRTRVKPVRGGNLIIVSRTQRSIDQADADLQRAMFWDI